MVRLTGSKADKSNPGPQPRLVHASGLFLCVASLLIAVYYMEGYLGLAPCPLCILDRIVIACLAILFLLALLINPRKTGQLIFSLPIAAFSMLGIALAWRHVWLQGLSGQALPDCAPDLTYMLDNFPLLETLSIVLNTSGECARVDWRFLSLSIPQQTLILFVALLMHALLIVYGCLRRKPSA